MKRFFKDWILPSLVKRKEEQAPRPSEEIAEASEPPKKKQEKAKTVLVWLSGIATGLVVATIAALIWGGGGLSNETEGFPELERLGPVSVEAQREAAPEESMTLLAEHLNLSVWAETTVRRARSGENFWPALTAGPGLECIELIKERVVTRTEIENCVEEDIRVRSQGTKEWVGTGGKEHRTAIAQRGLEYAWRAENPEWLMQAIIAYENGHYIDRGDTEFAAFAELYEHCPEGNGVAAERIGLAGSEIAAGEEFVNQIIRIKACVELATAERFPKLPPMEEGSSETEELKGEESQDSENEVTEAKGFKDSEELE